MKERWIAEPLVGVNGVEFGMERSQVRKILNRPFRVMEDMDNFYVCHVCYNAEGRCEAIEICDCDRIEVEINGVLVFPTDLDIIPQIASDFIYDEAGCDSVSKSIGIYIPDDRMEGILFGEKGYYERIYANK